MYVYTSSYFRVTEGQRFYKEVILKNLLDPEAKRIATLMYFIDQKIIVADVIWRLIYQDLKGKLKGKKKVTAAQRRDLYVQAYRVQKDSTEYGGVLDETLPSKYMFLQGEIRLHTNTKVL